MLERVLIRNYAIIDEQELEFTNGLNIITGETGAGKSIILGALDLVLGARAESGLLRDKSSKAVVEAIFRNYPESLDHLLAQNDVDLGPEVIMRREILPSGKSRAFINDTPVKLQLMRAVSSALIDMHQQFETLEIQQSRMQYEILDSFAGLEKTLSNYRELFAKNKALQAKTERLEEERRRAAQERDYIEFQLNEFENALPDEGDFESWEAEYVLQENAEEIKHALLSGAETLQHGDGAVLDLIQTIQNALSDFREQNPRLESLASRLESVGIEIEDIASELSDLESSFDPDPALKQELEDKIDAVRKLILKHGVQTADDLRNIAATLRDKLDSWAAVDNDLERMKKEQQHTFNELINLGQELTRHRHEHTTPLADQVNAMLLDLEMKNARFTIEVQELEEPHERGMDKIDFLFAANLGSELQPVGKVASGGELSRLSLCVKSAVAQKMRLPSMIFDEIDTGVSGQVALKMGMMLKGLSEGHQVIMITHSPQIAARASRHLMVSKMDQEKASVARVRILDDDKRIEELAKMLSGDPPTEAAVLNAKELINH